MLNCTVLISLQTFYHVQYIKNHRCLVTPYGDIDLGQHWPSDPDLWRLMMSPSPDEPTHIKTALWNISQMKVFFTPKVLRFVTVFKTCSSKGDKRAFLWPMVRYAWHYYDVIMGTRASQTTILTIVTPPFIHRSKKTSKLRVTGLCEGNSPVTGEFPAQRASNAENISIWWRHHELKIHGW